MTVTKREVATALETMLVNNEPLKYAHLIKFERPSKPDALTGRVSTSAVRYTYLTDASRDIKFDDDSIDLLGNANGIQTYLANKVISVGSVQEQTKATTSSTSLVLDGTSIGAYLELSSITVALTSGYTNRWDITVPSIQDIIDAGFREGDKVVINDTTVNISKFKANNTLEVKKIDTALTPATYTSRSIKLASEEIISILLNKNATEYASFINREVYIYRAYFYENGDMVGQNTSTYKSGPILIFKGIIYSVSFDDNDDGIKVSWGLNSHWGDFAQVKGRITSDSYHRALDDSGRPQPDSAPKREYAYDLGFTHSETSINMLATYTVMVEKMKIKAKSGFVGLGAKTKVKKYLAPEDRNTNLDFELNAKSIPIVYGVRMVEGIPIFADTMANDSSDVFVASVLSEGEIGGIYDIYIDGNSLICNDAQDYDARSVNTYNTVKDNNIELVCSGRADRGDALGGLVSVQEQSYNYTLSRQLFLGINPLSATVESSVPIAPPKNWKIEGYTYSPSMNLDFNDRGLIDGESVTLESPQKIVLDLFSGKTGQRASAQLTNIAYAGMKNPDSGFKIQKSYWNSGGVPEYWGPNHRLLDTAYTVGRFKISDGETTIPELKYVIRGKVLDCYNYDYSYSHYSKNTTESEANFKLGSYVSLKTSSSNTDILPVGGGTNSYQIIDKWTFANPNGTYNTRFRFDKVPNLAFDSNDTPSITKFYMLNASSQRWTMITYNHNEYYSATNAGPIYSTISSVTTTGTLATLLDPSDLDYTELTTNYASTNLIELNYSTNTDMAAVTDNLPAFQIMQSDSSLGWIASYQFDKLRDVLLQGATSGSKLTTGFESTSTSILNELNTYAIGKALVALNCVKLSADPSGGVNDYFTGYIIEISRYNSATGKTQVQSAEITKYLASSKIVVIDSLWEFIPISTDSIRIYQKYADSRVSINPAIQTLDYIKAPTYGKGLDPYKDLNLPSWLETARKCDTRSNVTIKMSGSLASVSVGQVYKRSSGDSYWQGTVASIHDTNYVEFTDCIGKLTNKWNSWKQWKVGDIIYNSKEELFVVTTSQIFTTEPTSSTSGLSTVSNITLTSGAINISTISGGEVNGNPIQSVKDGNKISGYSLYDSDDINYWRLTGWDEHEQRYVTKYQTNAVIDTSAPLFDNINSLLEHYNGIMRYSSGKYYLDIEEAAGTISTSDIRTITSGDIVGSIKLTDEGVRSAFNSLTAAFADPGNKYEARSISFFNSDYLKADRNVPKKGNLSVPAVTNYYNTRLLADSFLNKSRYGLTINITVRTHGILLLAGTVIQVIFPRYDWVSPGQKFRIESINYQQDGLADIVAKEYDDSFYSILNIKRGAGGNIGSVLPGIVLRPDTDMPTNLTVSQDLHNQIKLTWDPGPNASESSYTEIWRSDTPDFTVSNIVAVIPNTTSGINEYIDTVAPEFAGDAYIPRYYRVRRRVIN